MIETEHGAIDHNWKQIGPSGTKLASMSIQWSLHGVRWSSADLILEVKGYSFNYSRGYQV